MKTSDMFTEDQRCTISDLPSPWCGCWKCRPDVQTDIPGMATYGQVDYSEENR